MILFVVANSLYDRLENIFITPKAVAAKNFKKLIPRLTDLTTYLKCKDLDFVTHTRKQKTKKDILTYVDYFWILGQINSCKIDVFIELEMSNSATGWKFKW